MNPTVPPFADKSFGAVIADVDLNAIEPAAWQIIEDAFHEHAALVFPGQFLSEAAQVAFGMRFGEIEVLRENSKAVQISNKKPDGTLYGADDFRFKTLRGNEGWHMDSTYYAVGSEGRLTIRRRDSILWR